MKSKVSIYQTLQTEAMYGILSHSEAYFYRKVCRWYSKSFSTPLHDVLEGHLIQWDEMLLHYYESQMENVEYDEIYELACREYVPELAEQFEQDNTDFAKALEEEQERTIAKKKQQEIPPEVKPPTMNLSFDDEDFGEDQ